MSRSEHMTAVFYRTADLLGLEAVEPEAFGPLQVGGNLDGFAVSITGRSGGAIPGAYRTRFLVMVDPDRVATLPRGFRAEPWAWWHGWIRWMGDASQGPVVGVTAKDRARLAVWLTPERWDALRTAVSIEGFRAADGIFVADQGGFPETPADLTDPLQRLVAAVTTLVA